MFYQAVCDPCDGNGRVNAETKEAVSKEVIIFVLMKELKQAQAQLSFMKTECKCTVEDKGHWDTFKISNGGRQRFD
jgi:hypothetical protein